MESIDIETLEIEGVSQRVILDYFKTLNAAAFDETSQLFAEAGAMQPPFEQPIIGRDAIAQYLKREAKGIVADPKQGESQALEDGCTEFQITGRVQTPMFGVNVAWRMIVNPDNELVFVRIKLIASPKELLNLRPS